MTTHARALLDELSGDFADDPDVQGGTMFRSPGLRVKGKVFAFVGTGDRLIAKLPPEQVRAHLADGTGTPVTMGQRTMKEWLSFPADEDPAHTLQSWRPIARAAHDYVRALAEG